MKEIILYISALLLVSCATPQMRAPSIDQDESAEEAENQVKYAFEKYFEQTTRVNKISTNIRMTNAYLCNDFLAPYYGFDVWTIDDFKNAKQLEKKVLRNTYQLRENIKIRYVDKGSPAFLSGLRFGDEIDEVNGKKISGGRTM
jgi:C-terminal processing protease CtpA/Prc